MSGSVTGVGLQMDETLNTHAPSIPGSQRYFRKGLIRGQGAGGIGDGTEEELTAIHCIKKWTAGFHSSQNPSIRLSNLQSEFAQ